MIPLLVGPRQSGRTTELLRRMRALTEARQVIPVLVCTDAQRAVDLYRSTLTAVGGPWASSWQFCTQHDLTSRTSRLGFPDVRFVVDDADRLLNQLLGVEVALAMWEGP